MSDRPETQEEPRVVVTDKRRLDPETGKLRVNPFQRGTGRGEAADPADPAGAAQPLTVTLTEFAELEAAQQEAAERTADLQRVTAEYANYRKRVDRDREQVLATARERVLTELLPVLDDIDRAEAHGDVTGAFRTVTDKLTATTSRLGLQRFAAEGDPFDPARHEAVQFAVSPQASEQSVAAVLRHGYTLGDRVIRVAVVAVVGPGDDPAVEEAAAAAVDDVFAAPPADEGASAGLGPADPVQRSEHSDGSDRPGSRL